MEKAKILFLAFDLPFPLDRGGRIKTFHFLRGLARKSEVTVVALNRSPEEHQYLDTFKGWLKNIYLVPIDVSLKRKLSVVVNSLGNKKPFIISLYFNQKAQELIRTLCQNEHFDIIYADHLHMSQYVPHDTPSYTILDEHNIEASLISRFEKRRKLGVIRLFSRYEGARLKTYETHECRRFNHIITTTDLDASIIQQYIGTDKKISAIPIGVDTEYFQPSNQRVNTNTIISLGTLGWPPNAEGTLWFYHEVFPIIKAQRPEIKWQIIGDRAPSEILKLDKQKGIEILGRVDDIRPYLSNCVAVIVPLQVGSGMRVKILTALAIGVPVITTSIGCEGIKVEHGKDLLIADTPQDFAHALIRLFQEEELPKKLSTFGRHLVENEYSWEIVYQQLENLVERTLIK
jgi:polysaccharide biosynthesis protein PslH